MSTFTGDLAIAIRRFRRRPLFFLGGCALLGLAVGSNTAIFSVANGVLFRPLPLRNPRDVVALHVVRDGMPRGAFSAPMFLDLAAAARTLDGVAACFQWSANLTDAGDAERLQAMRASANYFQVVGADVALGRGLDPADGRPNAAPAVVIADGLWKRRFGASSDAIGRRIRLNGDVYTIVGVLRPDFPFQIRDAELIVPWAPEQDSRRGNAALSFLRVVGRLAPGSGIAQAKAELEARVRDVRRRYPEATAGDRGGQVVSLHDDLAGNSDRVIGMLAAAVVLVLIIAGANLANLLVVNGAGRLQEFASRRALGASRSRLVRQLLTEALLLAGVGAICAVLVAQGATSALLTLGDIGLPKAADVSVDSTAVLFAVSVSLLMSFAAALLPALQLSTLGLRDVAAQRGVTLGGRRLRGFFVCAEVAISVLLLTGAGLLVRSFVAVQHVAPGFEPSGVLTIRLSLPRQRYPATRDLAGFYDRVSERIRAVPGVSAVAAANVVPLNRYLATAMIQPPGFESQPPDSWPEVHYRMISPDYLPAMRIPILAGRTFNDRDNAAGAPVVVVSQGLAKRYWPGTSPVGSQIRVRDAAEFRVAQIVGVVGDVRHFGLEEDSPPEIYVPIPQVPDATSVWLANNMYWVVRTDGIPLAHAAAVRGAIAAVDADVAASFVRSMDQWMADSVNPRRFNMRVVALFAVSALLLAAIGVYSVAAETVALRTREIGVRAALGANAAQLTRAIMKAGLVPVLGGVVLGAGASLATAGVLSSFVFGITPRDPATFAVVSVTMVAVVVVALYVPARRVRRVDPVVALRAE